MRWMAAKGHPGLQDWAAQDAARHGVEMTYTPAASPMTLSERGADFIKSYELKPGKDTFDPSPYGSLEGGAATIGWGHKIKKGESFPKPLSSDEADALFYKDIDWAQKLVRDSLGQPVNQQQFDALVSLAHNYPKAFYQPAFANALQSGDWETAANQMATFSAMHRGKAVLHPPGLAKRRDAEVDIFNNGHYFNNH